jgi:hypothetical protein
MKSKHNISMAAGNHLLTPPRLSERSFKSKFRSVRWRLRSVALYSLLMLVLPAQAADYILSDYSVTLPPGVIIDSAGNYSSGALTLGAGDTITIGDTKPAIITFSGQFTTGANSLINVGRLASDLTLGTNGTRTLGAGSNVNAEVMGSAAINLGIGSTLGGNLSATIPTGVATPSSYSSLDGFIQIS